MWADDEKLITNKCLYSCFNLHGKDIQLEALHSDRPSYHISAKFSQVFNFANSWIFNRSRKYFNENLTHGMQCARATNSRNYFNEIFKNRYSQKMKI